MHLQRKAEAGNVLGRNPLCERTEGKLNPTRRARAALSNFKKWVPEQRGGGIHLVPVLL